MLSSVGGNLGIFLIFRGYGCKELWFRVGLDPKPQGHLLVAYFSQIDLYPKGATASPNKETRGVKCSNLMGSVELFTFTTQQSDAPLGCPLSSHS